MIAAPTVAIDLPLKALVWQDEHGEYGSHTTIPNPNVVKYATLNRLSRSTPRHDGDPGGPNTERLAQTLDDTKISRKDFGLTWNAALESGGILVGDEVTINLDVQFIRATG